MPIVLRLRDNESVVMAVTAADLVRGENRPVELRLTGQVGERTRTLYLPADLGDALVKEGAKPAHARDGDTFYRLDYAPEVWVIRRSHPPGQATRYTLAPVVPTWTATPPPRAARTS